MTTPVRVQQSIRQLETKGLTHAQIARELGVSRTTVVKYASRDYSPVPAAGREGSRSLVVGRYARRADGTVTQTRLFSLFCAHYGFETRFCNPYSGWE